MIGDERRQSHRLTFGEAADRLLIYVMTLLIGWLCINSIALRDQMAVLVERTTTDRQAQGAMQAEIAHIHEIDGDLQRQINGLHDQNLKHGWPD